MSNRRIGILGTGSYVPEKILSNFDLEKTLDTNDEWIYKRTGIKERRIAEPESIPQTLLRRPHCGHWK